MCLHVRVWCLPAFVHPDACVCAPCATWTWVHPCGCMSGCVFVCTSPRACKFGHAHTIPMTPSTQGLACACSYTPYLSKPGSACMEPLLAGSGTGVNEGFSAPGCTQGLRGGCTNKAPSPRRWLPGAGWGVGASGLGSTTPRRGCLVSRSTAGPNPVPSRSPGPASAPEWLLERPAPLHAPSPHLHRKGGPQS